MSVGSLMRGTTSYGPCGFSEEEKSTFLILSPMPRHPPKPMYMRISWILIISCFSLGIGAGGGGGVLTTVTHGYCPKQTVSVRNTWEGLLWQYPLRLLRVDQKECFFPPYFGGTKLYNWATYLYSRRAGQYCHTVTYLQMIWSKVGFMLWYFRVGYKVETLSAVVLVIEWTGSPSAPTSLSYRSPSQF